MIDGTSKGGHAEAKGLGRPPVQQSRSGDVRLAMLALACSGLLLNFSNLKGGLSFIPVEYTLKDGLGLRTTGAATFIALVGIPWYLKPLGGILIDRLAAKTPYSRLLVIGCLTSAALWFLVPVAKNSVFGLAAILLILNIVMALCHTLFGGQTITWGKHLGATGRLNATKLIAEAAAGLASNPLGGLLASKGLTLACLVSSGVLTAEAAVAAATRKTLDALQTGPVSQLADLKDLIRNRDLLRVGALLALMRFSPALQMPLFYHQTESLGFTPSLVALTRVSASVGTILGSAIYFALCRRVKLGTIIGTSSLTHVGAMSLYLFYTSFAAGLAIDFTNYLIGSIVTLAVADFASRTARNGTEATSYALVFSIGNIGWMLSDVFGSYLYDVSNRSYGFAVWPGAVTSGFAYLVALRLSKEILRTKEG